MHAMLRVVAVSVRGQLMKEFIEVDDVAGLPVVTPAMQKDHHDQVLILLSQGHHFLVGMLVLKEIQVITTFVELYKRTGVWQPLLRREAFDVPLLGVMKIGLRVSNILPNRPGHAHFPQRHATRGAAPDPS